MLGHTDLYSEKKNVGNFSECFIGSTGYSRFRRNVEGDQMSQSRICLPVNKNKWIQKIEQNNQKENFKIHMGIERGSERANRSAVYNHDDVRNKGLKM